MPKRTRTTSSATPPVEGLRNRRQEEGGSSLRATSSRLFSKTPSAFLAVICCLLASILLIWPAVSLMYFFSAEVSGASTGLTEPGISPSPDEILIVDTDAGVDDAVAILTLLGDPTWGGRISGITCLRGNTEARNVAVNVLKILKISNRMEVPVYGGSEDGLVESPPVGKFFGQDGLNDANYPQPPPSADQLLQKDHAAVFLAGIVKKKPVTLVTLGPMTNVALAMRLNPGFMGQLKRMVSLGGAIKEGSPLDKVPAVEYNIFMDPDAAGIVFRGVAAANREPGFFTLVPSETVHSNPLVMKWRVEVLGKINSSAVDLMNRIEKKYFAKDSWLSYDVYAATVLMRSGFVSKVVQVYADIETSGKLTRGRMVADLLNVTGNPPNVRAVTEIDTKLLQEALLANLKPK